MTGKNTHYIAHEKSGSSQNVSFFFAWLVCLGSHHVAKAVQLWYVLEPKTLQTNFATIICQFRKKTCCNLVAAQRRFQWDMSISIPGTQVSELGQKWDDHDALPNLTRKTNLQEPKIQ